MNKKRLRERILDISYGAGLNWIEGDNYFEESSMENYGRLIQGLEKAFVLPADTRLRSPWCLGRMEDIDSLVELMDEVLSFDVPKE